MTKQSGEGKLGCFVTIILLVSFGFVCFRSLPVLMDRMDFEDQVERIVSEAGARGWDPEIVRTQIVELAKNKEFEVAPEGLLVLRTGIRRGGDIQIAVNYSRTVNFVVYVYTFRFRTEAKSFVGTL